MNIRINHWYMYSVQIVYFISLYSYIMMANQEDKPTDELPNSLPESEGKHNHRVMCSWGTNAITIQSAWRPHPFHTFCCLMGSSCLFGCHHDILCFAPALCVHVHKRAISMYARLRCLCCGILFATTWLKRWEYNLSWWCSSFHRFTRQI